MTSKENESMSQHNDASQQSSKHSTPSNLEHSLGTSPRKVRPINNKALSKLNLSATEQEQILRRNANSRRWKSHKFITSITWEP